MATHKQTDAQNEHKQESFARSTSVLGRVPRFCEKSLRFHCVRAHRRDRPSAQPRSKWSNVTRHPVFASTIVIVYGGSERWLRRAAHFLVQLREENGKSF